MTAFRAGRRRDGNRRSSSLGADAVVDHTTTDITDLDERFVLIIDTGGRSPLLKLRRTSPSSGTYVIVGAETGRRFAGGVGRNLRAVPATGQQTTLVEAPNVNPGRTASGRTHGKTVITVAGRVSADRVDRTRCIDAIAVGLARPLALSIVITLGPLSCFGVEHRPNHAARSG